MNHDTTYLKKTSRRFWKQFNADFCKDDVQIGANDIFSASKFCTDPREMVIMTAGPAGIRPRSTRKILH